MVDVAVNHLRAANGSGTLVLEQFRTSFGIPDIIHLQYDPEKLEARLHTTPSPTDAVTRDSARVAALISHSRISEPNAARALNFSARRLAKALTPLVSRNVLAVSGDDIRVRELQQDFLLESITVYEAKLKNRGRAIAQAQRHLWFANSSLILLPVLSEALTERSLIECRAAGVGLATVDRENVKVVFNPSSLRVAINWMTWYLNELLFEIKSLEANAV
jgi:hypothetical protein